MTNRTCQTPKVGSHRHCDKDKGSYMFENRIVAAEVSTGCAMNHPLRLLLNDRVLYAMPGCVREYRRIFSLSHRQFNCWWLKFHGRMLATSHDRHE